MSPFQFQLVRLTWAQMQPRASQWAPRLREHLALPAELALVGRIDALIHGLDRPGPDASAWPAGLDMERLGQALMLELAQALGPGFSPAVQEAWEALWAALRHHHLQPA
jgi:hypothetical protein